MEESGSSSDEAVVARYGALAEQFVGVQDADARAHLHGAVLAATLALGAGASTRVRTAAQTRVVVPVLRERYLRGVVASRTVHAAAAAPALALVAEAMQLADALCAVFGAAWTVAPAPAPARAASPDQFCVLLVTLCATTVRTRAPSAAAVAACAAVLQHAVAFLACDDNDDDDDDDDGGSEWWTCLQAPTLLAVRARLLETLGDVCETLAEAGDGDADTPATPALARLLAEWLVLDDDDRGAGSVAVRAVRCFGGRAERLLALFRRAQLDTRMPGDLYALLCARVEHAAAAAAAAASLSGTQRDE